MPKDICHRSARRTVFWAVLRAVCLLAPLITLTAALPARALPYADLVLDHVSLVPGEAPVARMSLRILGIDIDPNLQMAELELGLSIPIESLREIEMTLSMSDALPKGAAQSGVRQRVRLGGNTDMGPTITNQMEMVPRRKVVASVCESLLVSGFRAELLRKAAAQSPEGLLRTFWTSPQAQQAIVGLAGHCLFWATKRGILPGNPLVLASVQASATQSAGQTSRDFAASVKGLSINNFVSPDEGDNLSSSRVTLMSVTVEGQPLGTSSLYGFFWGGNLSTGNERTVYYGRTSLGPTEAAKGVVEGDIDLVLTKDGIPPDNAQGILRQTPTPYLLLLKHLLESEPAIRRSALKNAPLSNEDAFATFWAPLANQVMRGPILDLVGEELALRYKPLPEDLKTVQKALAALGHYKGEIDGETGSKTRAALRTFERFIGSTSDSYLTIWETALLAPDLLEPARDGASTKALRAELQAQAAERQAEAERRLGIRLDAPEPTAEAPLPFAIAAQLESQKARNIALQRRLADMQVQVRRKASETKQWLNEAERDLAQCSCAGELDCLSAKVELP